MIAKGHYLENELSAGTSSFSATREGRATGLKELLKEKAGELGLWPVGVTSGEPLVETRRLLAARRAAGEVTPFVVKDLELRTDPGRVWPATRSVLMVGLRCAVAAPPAPRGLTGYLAAGTEGRDYHQVLREHLRELSAFLKAEAPEAEAHVFVDTTPLCERPLAWRAGLGVWGENTCLLPAEPGPAFFLGGLLLSVRLEPDEPQSDGCLRCGRCRKACPTGALAEPYRLQAGLCLSYLTQMKGSVPRALRPYLGNRLYGCDACLAACPLIKKAPTAGAEVDLREILALDRRGFAADYGATAAGWRGRTVLQRNAVYALGNLGDPAAVPLLLPLLEDVRPVIRAAAAWSLGRIGGAQVRASLARRLSSEPDLDVVSELAEALT